MRRFPFFLLLIGTVVLGVRPGAAQAQQAPARPSAIADVLLDRDGDLAPDAVGDTVLVAGRVTMGSGDLHLNWTEVFLQDATGGIKLVASSAAPPVAQGDSLVAWGVLAFENGMAQISDPTYQVVQTERRLLEPEAVDLRETTLEAIEGRLVEMKGTVVAHGAVEVGEHLIVLVHDQLVVVFVYTNRNEPFAIEGFEVGDYVRVRGIAAQFDRAPPYDGSYQLYPRTATDVELAGLPPVFYRVGLTAIAVLLLLVLAWVGALRRQVRKRVDQLRATETRYSHLLSSAGDAVFIHGAHLQIEEVNEVATEALGYSSPQVLHRSLAEFVAPEGRDAFARHVGSLDRFGGGQDVIALQAADGTGIPFEFRSRRLELAGKRVVISIARDVAARQAYERGLIEARQEAEQARLQTEEMARLKSAFLANMSHEIRTPLTAIIGFAQLLHDEVMPEQQELTDHIRRGGTRLLDTLTAVLDLARLDAGHDLLTPEPIEVVTEIHRIAGYFEEQAEAKDLLLLVEADVPSLHVHHDLGALERILHHLLDNAFKFTVRGAVRVRLRTAPDVIHLDVTDTGVGIDEAFLPQLFEAFKQESDGLGRHFEGTGLGLTIAQRFVELMGGAITVQSRKGLGTQFTVTLPRTPIPASGDGAGEARFIPLTGDVLTGDALTGDALVDDAAGA